MRVPVLAPAVDRRRDAVVTEQEHVEGFPQESPEAAKRLSSPAARHGRPVERIVGRQRVIQRHAYDHLHASELRATASSSGSSLLSIASKSFCSCAGSVCAQGRSRVIRMICARLATYVIEPFEEHWKSTCGSFVVEIDPKTFL
jgi:hypothetical protein